MAIHQMLFLCQLCPTRLTFIDHPTHSSAKTHLLQRKPTRRTPPFWCCWPLRQLLPGKPIRCPDRGEANQALSPGTRTAETLSQFGNVDLSGQAHKSLGIAAYNACSEYITAIRKRQIGSANGCRPAGVNGDSRRHLSRGDARRGGDARNMHALSARRPRDAEPTARPTGCADYLVARVPQIPRREFSPGYLGFAEF